MQDITVQALSDGLYLVENNNGRRYLVVMGDGIGQAFDLAGDPVVNGTGVLRALGVTRVMKLSDKTEIKGDWFTRDDKSGNISRETAFVATEIDQEELDASEAFNQCKVRPNMDEVKRRDATDAALDDLYPLSGVNPKNHNCGEGCA